jgi:salicylate hydroxylase
MLSLDIAVAGCGPAGLAAALLLARDGHRVTLYERFETPRPIGSGLMLQPAGMAVLEAMGLSSGAMGAGARIDRLIGLAGPSGRTVLDVRYAWLRTPGLHGIGIHRAALFDLLYEPVLASPVRLETKRTIIGSELGADGRRRLCFEGGRNSPAFDLVIDALGSSSPLTPPGGRELAYGALWASLDWVPGFDSAALEQRYVRAEIMTGVMPIGRAPGHSREQAAFFWLLRADRLAEWRTRGLDRWKEEVRALWPATAPLLDQIHDPDQLVFGRYAHRTSRSAETGLIRIGDSWHATSPQLGQGANMALLDAWAVAKALREARDTADAVARAVAMRRFHVRLYQLLSAIFTPAYQSDSRILPFIRDRIVPPLSHLWPATWLQAAMVAGLFGGPLQPLGLQPPLMAPPPNSG